jgi:hypothetical protein
MRVLITLQEPGRPRIRVVVNAPSTFDAVDKVMSKATEESAPFDVNTYVAARPATAEDIEKHMSWSI